MNLTSLSLANFRSYHKKTFEFFSDTTLIMGPNAAGKTNILEAIMLLVTGKSFRADADREGIRWGEELAVISSQFIVNGQAERLEIKMNPLKHFFVNGVPRRLIDFIGNIRAVLFWPEDLELVTNSPSYRRKYLDSVLVQVDRQYRRHALSYERGLRQRNKLLDLISEGKASQSQLLFWNQLLIKSGGYITDIRQAYMDFANSTKLASHMYEIIYDKSVISQNRLDQYRNEEIAAKATLVGPHRDDFSISKATVDLNKYGSRGEQRLAVLWLKLAQLSYIEKYTGTRPILLLDDIFSELDTRHRKIVMGVIQKQQTILTSAHKDIIGELGNPPWQRIEL